MKKKSLLFRFLVFAVIMSVSISCSKDKDDEGDDTEEFESITFAQEEVINKLPDGLKNSTDTYAQSVVSYVESALNWSSFIDNMNPPENAELTTLKSASSGSSYKWSWSYGGYSMVLYWQYSEDASKKYWNMDIQYNNGPKYKYIEAWESKNGVKGEIKYNFAWTCAYAEAEETCEDLYMTYTWEKDASNNYHFKYIYESDGTEYDELLSYEILVNDDGSGNVDYYYLGQRYYYLEWDVQGNGSWALYSDGQEALSGTWTVN